MDIPKTALDAAGGRAEFFVLEFVLERGAFSHPFASLDLRV